MNVIGHTVGAFGAAVVLMVLILLFSKSKITYWQNILISAEMGLEVVQIAI
jgi:hypothetical protein